MLKVLIVSHGHPDLSHGGAEVASYLLFEGLRQTPGVRAYFLARTGEPTRRLGEGAIAPYRDRTDEMLFYADGVDPFLFSQKNGDAIANFCQLLQQIAPDVIHFHHYITLGLELIAVARQYYPRVKIVVTLHEFLAICHHFGQMVKTGLGELCTASTHQACNRCFPDISVDRFVFRETFIKAHFDKVDLFIAPSRFLCDRYIAWGMPSWQIVVLDNCMVPVEAVAPRPTAPGEKRGIFGFFGQVNPFKGLLQLLQAFRLLAQVQDDMAAGIKLVVHGDYLELNPAPYVAAIRKLLAETADRVHFAGPYAYDDLGRAMGQVDWVIVPSVWWENSPMVIQEAFVHRRPVICSNIGGMAEKVRWGQDGYHFPVGDVRTLASLIMQVASDTKNWDRLQQTIRRPAPLADTVNRHIDIYRDNAFTFA